MKKFKFILLKILFPHGIVVMLLALVSTIMLIYSFVFENVNDVIKYFSYFISAYSLTIVCVKVPVFFRWIKAFKQKNKYLSQYFGSVVLRVKISLYSSLALNIAYAVMQFSLGIYNHSIWFYALSIYYFLLALMRFFLLKEARKNREKPNLYFEYLSYRFCGIVLLFINIALFIITFYIVEQNRGFSYHYIMTIAMAAYTFFTFTVAIINVIKYRKYNSPIISTSKVISFAAAFVSMLSLETAMLTAFGKENSSVFRKNITACTGAAVCFTILSIAIYMIVHSTRQLHQIKEEMKENE